MQTPRSFAASTVLAAFAAPREAWYAKRKAAETMAKVPVFVELNRCSCPAQ